MRRANRRPPVERTKPLVMYVGALERTIIQETAKACGMTVSAYLRAMALGQKPRSTLDLGAVRSLAQISADQRTLVASLSLVADPEERWALLKQIQDVQGRLVEAAKQVRT